VDVLGFAVTPHQLDVVVWTRPDQTDGWSDAETIQRWRRVFPADRAEKRTAKKNGRLPLPKKDESPDRIGDMRQRLGTVSWFMRCLNEWLARTANREDGMTGRFWEGRFKCRVLLDESAIVTCLAYVDLIPFTHALLSDPGRMEHSSYFDRVQSATPGRSEAWLCPMGKEAVDEGRSRVSLDLEDYLALIDWTARQWAPDPGEPMPDSLTEILRGLQIHPHRWVETVAGFERLFHRVAGRADSMAQWAEKAGKHWMAGVRSGQAAFIKK
jgi:hypothetical protein